MGYFKRKLRRSQARQDADGFLSTTPAGEWTLAERDQIAKDAFVRFAIDGRYDQTSARLAGIFREFYELVDTQSIAPDLTQAARDALRWFNSNLPAPRVARRDAIFWFRASQHEMIDCAFTIIEAIRASGHVVQQLQTLKPGRIVYEDDHQVAAVPWRDTDLKGTKV